MFFKERAKRETGFELLRIIAMFLIGAVHVMNYGGMLQNGLPQTIKWQRLIYAVFTVAVNVFVLISAYFMVKSKLKPKKIVYLWLQVVAYSVGCYMILCVFSDAQFSLFEFVKCCIPVISNKYWFFTAYFLLMLVSPFLNKILHHTSKKELLFLNLLLFLMVCVSNSLPIVTIISLNGGYSLPWFIFLYIFAGMLRLYPLSIKKWVLGIVYVASTLLLWLCSFLDTTKLLFQLINNQMIYTSPLVLIASISIFLLFKGINIKNNFIHNTICWISSLTFGIYLLQESAIKPWLYFDCLRVQMFYSSVWSPLAVLLVALEIFVVGLVCEIIRKLLLLCIKPITVKIEGWIENKLTAKKEKVASDNASQTDVEKLEEEKQGLN